MDKACIIPWQSLMIRADGSVRPCCNSNRTLNTRISFDGDNIWNTSESIKLRSEMLSGDLDSFCKVCKTRNVDPPEEIISKTYTQDAIFCDSVPPNDDSPLHAASVEPLTHVGSFPSGQCGIDAFGADQAPRLRDDKLIIGNVRYPTLSKTISASLGILGHFDDCYLTGTHLRCRGWVFDRSSDRRPDLFAVFSRDKFVAISQPIGERYDVGKHLSSSNAVDSGFFFDVQLSNNSNIAFDEHIHMIALFFEPTVRFDEGYQSLSQLTWKRRVLNLCFRILFIRGFAYRMSAIPAPR